MTVQNGRVSDFQVWNEGAACFPPGGVEDRLAALHLILKHLPRSSVGLAPLSCLCLCYDFVQPLRLVRGDFSALDVRAHQAGKLVEASLILPIADGVKRLGVVIRARADLAVPASHHDGTDCRQRRVAENVSPPVLAIDHSSIHSHHFAFPNAGQLRPEQQVDTLGNEADGSIPEADVPPAGMFGIHLADVKRRKVDRVNDWKTGDVEFAAGGSGMDERQRGGRVRTVFRRGEFRMRKGTRNDADPGLLAQIGRMLPQENGVGRPINDVAEAGLGVPKEWPIRNLGDVSVNGDGPRRSRVDIR